MTTTEIIEYAGSQAPHAFYPDRSASDSIE